MDKQICFSKAPRGLLEIIHHDIMRTINQVYRLSERENSRGSFEKWQAVNGKNIWSTIQGGCVCAPNVQNLETFYKEERKSFFYKLKHPSICSWRDTSVPNFNERLGQSIERLWGWSIDGTMTCLPPPLACLTLFPANSDTEPNYHLAW